MAKQAQPRRPQSVPQEARWVAADRTWVLGTGKGGSRQGAFAYWRADGTLAHECAFKSGVHHGPFRRLHENGEVAQQGQYVEGELHGLCTWVGSSGPTTEARHVEAGPAVWKTQVEYELGRVLATRHFDRAGERVNADGSKLPQRPKAASEKAAWDAGQGAWVDQLVDKQGKLHGRVRSWTPDGRRLEEADWEHGLRHGMARRFGPEDRVAEEGRYRKAGRTGVFRFFTEDGKVAAEREYHGGQLSGHTEEYDGGGELELEETYVRGLRDGVFRLRTSFWNPKVHEVQGSWRKGVPESPWTLMGHDGVPLQWLEMGTQDGRLSEAAVFGDRPQPAQAWRAQALQLEEEGRRNLALVALARAAASEALVEPLLAGLSRLAIPVAGPRAEKIFDEAARAGTAAALLTGLRTGASASLVFERLAAMLDARGRSRAALDLVNAAVLLEPERPQALGTRALVLFSLGASEAGLRDANALASADPEQSEALLDYGRVLFGPLDFWPAHEPLAPKGPVPPAAPMRGLPEVQAAAAVFATRLTRLREALLGRVSGSVPWRLPSLDALLPGGPVKLKERVREKKSRAEVDEARGLEATEVPALLKVARADWAGLCWLLWGAGAQAIELPQALAPPEQFAAALAASGERVLRCRDSRQGARFEWEGIDVDGLAPWMRAMPEAEWSQAHGVLKWLASEDVASPWQLETKGS